MPITILYANPEHTYSEEGDFIVSLVVCEDNGYCDSSSFNVNVINTGCSLLSNITVFEDYNISFSIYPNPTSGQLTLSHNVIEGDVKVTLINDNGITYFYQEGNLESISLSLSRVAENIPTGMYLVNIKHSKGTSTQQLFIQH